MATLKGVQRARRGPSYSGKFMIDTVRGILRVRKWPKKRGTPKSALQRWWIDWFRQANLLAKYVDAASARRAIEITANSGMYPRDVLLAAMRGRLYTWQDQNGKVWHPMAAIQDISESLDVLAQNVGNVLVRAVDRWRAAGPTTPAIGDALTYQGPSAPPIWTAAGSGVSQQIVPGTPIVFDNTANEYVVDVSAFATVQVTLDDVDFAAADFVVPQLSIDNGATYKTAGTDYHRMYTQGGFDVNGNADSLVLAAASMASAHFANANLVNLRAGRAVLGAIIGGSATVIRVATSHANFDGPITHIRFKAGASNNFTSGTLRLIGLLAG